MGPVGVLTPAMCEAIGLGERDVVRSIIRIVSREVINVANIFTYTRDRGICGAHEYPPFKWYDLGLSLSQEAFIESIDEYPESEDDMLLYAVRDVLKRIRFADLWDRVWEEAKWWSAVPIDEG